MDEGLEGGAGGSTRDRAHEAAVGDDGGANRVASRLGERSRRLCGLAPSTGAAPGVALTWPTLLGKLFDDSAPFIRLLRPRRRHRGL